MPYYSASAGISVATSTASTTFYQLTDHNRQPIDIGYEIIEKAQRMANGTMRKYVVSKKKRFSVSWNEIPSGTGTPANPASSSTTYGGYTMTVDGYKGGAWMKSFYETNLFKPIYVRVAHSQDTYSANSSSAFYPSTSSAAFETIQAFMTNFSYNIVKRYKLTDIVNVQIEFTEI